MRYHVVPESESGHCCFEATILDTERPIMLRGEVFVSGGEVQYESLCECFNLADAERIAAAMNAAPLPPEPRC